MEEVEIDYSRGFGVQHIILLVIAFIVGMAIIGRMLHAADIETCGRVTEQSKQNLPGFYVTDGERGACDRLDLPI